MASDIKEISCDKMFGGFQKVYNHYSSELKCDMKFGIYLPPQADIKKAAVLYWLSDLGLTEQKFVTESGAQKYASEYGLILVSPDTSPRGCYIEGENDSEDFGSGSGFYVNATQHKWKKNYRMFSYITEELPRLINGNFPADTERQSICGHGMGGHGALVCSLRNAGKYKSVSAFAPICNPVNCQLGQKAFTGYLGDDKEAWNQYDACHLVKTYNGPPLEILIDQGKKDNFLRDGQLLPDNLVAASAESKINIILRMHEEHDHGYLFIASFIGDHIKHHAKYLKGTAK